MKKFLSFIDKSNDRNVVQAGKMCIRYFNSFELKNLKSYEWYDIWDTPFGRIGKRLFLFNKYIGSLIIAPTIFIDLFYPSIRKYFVKKRSFPICHAQTGLGYLNLYHSTQEKEYLKMSLSLVDEIIEMASPSTSGLGWGMNHEWNTFKGFIPAGTPCNTQTAYVYEYFSELLEATHDNRFNMYLKKIANHVANDFKEWIIEGTLVSSYSILDNRRVVNANSYRALMLIDAGKRFNNQEYLNKGIATVKYVLLMQNENGSWPYAEDQSFIDSYHTCFILKNLNKIMSYNPTNLEDIKNAFDKGLEYYFSNLYNAAGYPIPYAIKPRFTLQKYDSYDFAESIGLISDLKICKKTLSRLINFTFTHFQTIQGWFIFRIYPLFNIKGIPYMRYANTAMFLALTKVIKNELTE